MYKTLVGLFFGLLLILVVSRHIEYDLISEIGDVFDRHEPEPEIILCGQSCTQEEIDIIVQNLSFSNCQLDIDCQFQYAVEHNLRGSCPNVLCKRVIDGRFDDVLFPNALKLRFSLDYNYNLCDGSMEDLLQEYNDFNNYVGDSFDSYSDFYYNISINDFCDYLIQPCTKYDSNERQTCINVKDDYDFWYHFSYDVGYNFYDSSFFNTSGFDNYSIFEYENKEEFLNVLESNVERIDLSNIRNDYELIAVIENVFSKEEITDFLIKDIERVTGQLPSGVSSSDVPNHYNLNDLSDLEGYKEFYDYPKSYYLTLSDSNYLYDSDSDFELYFDHHLLNNIADCDLSNTDIKVITNNFRSSSIFFTNPILIKLIKITECSDLSNHQGFIEEFLSHSEEDYFYKFIEDDPMRSLKFLNYFNIDNKNLERYLFKEFEEDIDSFNDEKSILLYSYLKND